MRPAFKQEQREAFIPGGDDQSPAARHELPLFRFADEPEEFDMVRNRNLRLPDHFQSGRLAKNRRRRDA